MPRARRPLVVVAVVLAVLAGLSAIALALADEAGRVPVPNPPKGKGETCVADTSFMRRYHMVMLLHQREQTVHEGVRTKRFSLKECVACHAVAGRDGQPVSYQEPTHFCRSCHDYAAVTIDCFECHASRPETKTADRRVDADKDTKALLHYLKDAAQ